jgi:putative membrane protein
MQFFPTLPASSGDGWDHAWWPLWLVFWLAVAIGAVWFFTRRRRDGGPQDGISRARDILAERFARGELTVDEYRERLGQLQ